MIGGTGNICQPRNQGETSGSCLFLFLITVF